MGMPVCQGLDAALQKAYSVPTSPKSSADSQHFRNMNPLQENRGSAKVGYHHVPTPMGTAIVGPCSDLVLPDPTNFSTLAYHAKEGVRIWLETGELREFEGQVTVRGATGYRVSVNTVDGAAVAMFLAVQIYAITPLKSNAHLMKDALQHHLQTRIFH